MTSEANSKYILISNTHEQQAAGVEADQANLFFASHFANHRAFREDPEPAALLRPSETHATYYPILH